MQVQIDRAEMIHFRELTPGDFFRPVEGFGDGNVNGAQSGDVGLCNIEGYVTKW